MTNLLAFFGLVLAVCLTTGVFAQPGPAGVPVLGRLGNTIPSQSYFQGIEQLYRGDYRDAERIFRFEAKGSIKIGVTHRWIDAICYHAMWGEVFYHQGQPAAALEQFNHACSMFLQYPQWLLLVEFDRPLRPDSNRLRQGVPWGRSRRQFTLGHFPAQMKVRQGDLFSANRAAQQGGVVRSPQYWQVNVIEILRCTALAIRRRGELLGPLAAHDKMSRELVTALARSGAPPNHWSQAWHDLLYGVAQASVGERVQAKTRLQRALLVAGKFDHPLTCVALLEQGRLAMEEGKTEAAKELLAEASYSAFYFEDLGSIDEAFRLGTINRLAGTPSAIDPSLEPAAAWVRRKRYDHIFSRLSLALTEELLVAGNWQGAAGAYKQAVSRLQDARAGLLGNRAQYLDARLQYQQSRESAEATLAQAVHLHVGMSNHNLQLQIANQNFDQQLLTSRNAVDVYKSLLEDPQPSDWIFYPLETMAVLKTPHGAAYERWLAALVDRKDMATALEITDLAKRSRFHNALAWGGRLAAIRDVLELPEHQLITSVLNLRNLLLLRFPEYNEAKKTGQQMRQSLQADWQSALDEDGQRDLVRLWQQWSDNLGERDQMLGQIALQRVPAKLQFPPLLAATDLQAQLQPGQAVAVFHKTTSGLIGFLVTAKESTSWRCGPSASLSGLLSSFLRDLGNYDANHELTAKELRANAWVESGGKLFDALFQGSSIDPESMTELVVVPDGIAWYVPFAALPVVAEAKTGEEAVPLIALSKVRFAPTYGLGVGHTSPWRRVQRTGIVGTALVPGDSDEERQQSLSSLQAVVPNPISFPTNAPTATPIMGSLLETLLVLDDTELSLTDPLGWSPIPAGRSAKRGTLSHWLNLPNFGPQRVLLPATHTIAERGGKISKRRRSAPPGTELFLASCGLLSTGAQTILLGNWKVGGESTMELLTEFMQELPYTTAADAWQRSVHLGRELPLDPKSEPRLKAAKDDPQLTASHPFFWAGYLLIDTGAVVQNGEDEAPVARLDAASDAEP